MPFIQWEGQKHINFQKQSVNYDFFSIHSFEFQLVIFFLGEKKKRRNTETKMRENEPREEKKNVEKINVFNVRP